MHSNQPCHEFQLKGICNSDECELSHQGVSVKQCIFQGNCNICGTSNQKRQSRASSKNIMQNRGSVKPTQQKPKQKCHEFHLSGQCKILGQGKKCKYEHGKPLGKCVFGANCRKCNNIDDDTRSRNSSQNSIMSREQNKPKTVIKCHDFHLHEFCKKLSEGKDCKFDHTRPALKKCTFGNPSKCGLCQKNNNRKKPLVNINNNQKNAQRLQDQQSSQIQQQLYEQSQLNELKQNMNNINLNNNTNHINNNNHNNNRFKNAQKTITKQPLNNNFGMPEPNMDNFNRQNHFSNNVSSNNKNQNQVQVQDCHEHQLIGSCSLGMYCQYKDYHDKVAQFKCINAHLPIDCPKCLPNNQQQQQQQPIQNMRIDNNNNNRKDQKKKCHCYFLKGVCEQRKKGEICNLDHEGVITFTCCEPNPSTCKKCNKNLNQQQQHQKKDNNIHEKPKCHDFFMKGLCQKLSQGKECKYDHTGNPNGQCSFKNTEECPICHKEKRVKKCHDFQLHGKCPKQQKSQPCEFDHNGIPSRRCTFKNKSDCKICTAQAYRAQKRQQE